MTTLNNRARRPAYAYYARYEDQYTVFDKLDSDWAELNYRIENIEKALDNFNDYTLTAKEAVDHLDREWESTIEALLHLQSLKVRIEDKIRVLSSHDDQHQTPVVETASSSTPPQSHEDGPLPDMEALELGRGQTSRAPGDGPLPDTEVLELGKGQIDRAPGDGPSQSTDLKDPFSIREQ